MITVETVVYLNKLEVASSVYLPAIIGPTGKSQYQSYLETTTDNPVLSKTEWANIYATKENKGVAAELLESHNSSESAHSELFALKVDIVTGKSLVYDTEIAKIHSQNTDSTLLSPDGTKSAYLDNSGALHVDSITWKGDTQVIYTQEIFTESDYIVMRDGATVGLNVGEYSGFLFSKYDGVNNGNLVVDKDGWARVGDVGSLQKIATIEENPTNGQLMKYNTTTSRLESSGKSVLDFALLAGGNIWTGNQTFDTNTLFVDSVNHRVGVGTTTPTSTVEIKSSYPIISLSSLGTNIAGSIDFRNTGGPAWRIGSNISFSENNNLEIVESGVNRMYFKPGGNVGIGTTNPLNKVSLVTSTDGDGIQIRRNSTGIGSYASLGFRINSTEALGNYAEIRAIRTDSVAGGSSDLIFLTYGNSIRERARILANGNIVFGATSSTSLFQVTQPTTGSGTVTTNGTITLTGSGTQFTNTFKVGDTITVSGETVRTIASIVSDTILTVSVAFSTSASGLSYTLVGGDRFVVKGNGSVTAYKLNVTDVIRQGNGDGGTYTGNIFSGEIRFYNGTTNTGGFNPSSADSTFYIRSGLYDIAFQAPTNTTRMFIQQSTGNVGIGTSSPQARLHVVGTVVPNKYIDSSASSSGFIAEGGEGRMQFIAEHTGTGGAGIALTNAPSTGNNTNWNINHVGPTVGDGLLFRYSQTTATNQDSYVAAGFINSLYLKEDGNIGIGTLTPSYRLSITQTSDVTTSGLGIVNTALTASARLWMSGTTIRLDNSSVQSIAVDISGNIGIGTASPSQKLHINGGTSAVRLRIDTTNEDSSLLLTTIGQRDWSIGIDYSDSGKLKFDTNSVVGASTKVTVDGSGNVGVGISSPVDKLQVAGGNVLIDNNNAYRIKREDGAAMSVITIDSSNLTIYGGAHATATTKLFQWKNSGSLELMTILGQGLVGIGTSNPGTRLDVYSSTNSILGRFQLEKTTGSATAMYIGSYGAGANNVGLQAFATAGANNTDLLLGNIAAPTGNFAIYSGGSSASYFNGKIGIGITIPSAGLHLKAGTATATTAPLKFSAGVLLTTPEIGAVEFIDDSTNGHFYITMNVAGVLTRREIAFIN